ncbi:MAG: hypothetical protein JSW20_09765 [Nitrospiraceae bacterium]|nr:MAG: hypothetical protein JSW20_09765 [Nitrospiraceae bacterium]
MRVKQYVLLFMIILITVSMSFSDDGLMTGTVKQLQKAGQYTYLTLDQKGTEVWVATTSSNVMIGDVIDYSEALLMENFEAKSLKKTLDKIYFTGGVKIISGPSLSKDASLPDDNVHKNIQTENIQATAPEKGEITRAENGNTIEEIYTKLNELNGKHIIVRARVMKVSKNILGTNWITLQDGTGSAPDNTIIALSSDIVGIADTVTVKGTVKADINLGSGYTYKAVIDKASLVK